MANSTFYTKQMIKRRKENHQCVTCGNPLDRDGTQCTSCRDRINKSVKETRDWYQSNGICPRCRKENLMGDEKQCPECNAKGYINTISTRNREHYNKVHSEWSKETHHKMIELGMCTRCRKRKADSGYKTCGICRSKSTQYKRNKYGKPDRRNRHGLGLCYFCDNPVKDGYKVCDFHYDKCVQMAHSENTKAARKNLVEKRILY